MVREIRDVEAAMGSNNPRAVNQGEALNRLSLSKSLVAAKDMAVGKRLNRLDIEVKSPGRGLQPNRVSELIGTPLTRQVKRGDFFYESDIFGAKSQSRDFSFDRSWGIPVRLRLPPESGHLSCKAWALSEGCCYVWSSEVFG